MKKHMSDEAVRGIGGISLANSGTPPGCDPINLAFPVVSADSDHRLLSLQPFGLRLVVCLQRTLAKVRWAALQKELTR